MSTLYLHLRQDCTLIKTYKPEIAGNLINRIELSADSSLKKSGYSATTFIIYLIIEKNGKELSQILLHSTGAAFPTSIPIDTGFSRLGENTVVYCKCLGPENFDTNYVTLSVSGTYAKDCTVDRLTAELKNRTDKYDKIISRTIEELNEDDFPRDYFYINSFALAFCPSLKKIKIPPWVTSLRSNCFQNDTALEEVYISNTIDYFASSAFQGCTNMERVVLENGFNCSILISQSTKYTKEVLLNIIYALKDRTSDSALTLTIGNTNLDKLTETDKAIATAKNWNLA